MDWRLIGKEEAQTMMMSWHRMTADEVNRLYNTFYQKYRRRPTRTEMKVAYTYWWREDNECAASLR